MTDAELQAQQLIAVIESARKPIAEKQASLPELKARRAEMESFTRVDSITLAERCIDHDRQIAVIEHALIIDQSRLQIELQKAAPILKELEKQTRAGRDDPEQKFDDDFQLYTAQFENEIGALVRESHRGTE